MSQASSFKAASGDLLDADAPDTVRMSPAAAAELAKGALLEKTPAPTDEQIRVSVESVYCRCTGYVRIEAAYREAVALAHKATRS